LVNNIQARCCPSDLYPEPNVVQDFLINSISLSAALAAVLPLKRQIIVPWQFSP